MSKSESSCLATKPDTRNIEARAWVLSFASGDVSPEKERAFADWLVASPANRDAFYRARGLWDGMAEVDGIEDLLMDQNNISALKRPVAPTRRLMLGGGLAAVLALAAGVGLLAHQPAAPVESILIATQRGEIRTFALSDGSEITLGGASRIQGDFTDQSRQLELVAGNAYFDIARDENRPLTVDTGGVQVRVLGTRFDVKRRADRVSVSVDSGHVSVRAAAGEARDLLAGDKIVSTPVQGLGKIEKFDLQEELSWRSGRLSFVNAPLRDIVADMNQYSERPVRLTAGAPGDMRLTLSFSTQQIGQVLAGLDAAYPIQVKENDTEILIMRDF
ncbi:FecR family protein [Hyphomonas pacifica]|uniref:FecR protein domain-containing protein n=1 Tax=Hyphomonas pacifica TaxID=1280941 RepID=A0A062TVC2_9PROT|nr:FecR domain-containing protein [Hyphomonas pacifica]KCZ49255.1 hypothetical protein HY2_15450 [Hyphomonas pacifica]RAN31923.1 hypothetical protein HY3_16020 [Hyphomonas pacifica]